MECLECHTTNPDDNRYCGKCGAELGRTLDETVRKKGFRDRQALEMEITETVAERLMKWAKWIGAVTGLLILAFGLLIGSKYHDISTAVEGATSQIQSKLESAKRNIEASTQNAKSEIEAAKKDADALNRDLQQLRANTERYKHVNEDIDKLQKRITHVEADVLDIGNKSFKAKSITTTGTGPGVFSVGELGCPIKPDSHMKAALCIDRAGQLEVVTEKGARPVGASSMLGFQDTSPGVPGCDSKTRGTFVMEKGEGSRPDRPLVCARRSDNSYSWILLGTVP